MVSRALKGLSCSVAAVLFSAPSLGAYSVENEPSAVRVGPVLTVVTGTVNGTGQGTIAYNSVNDEYYVVWNDFEFEMPRGVLRNDIYARRVSVDGGFVDNAHAVIADENSTFAPSAVHDPVRNQYLVAWKFQGNIPGTPSFNHLFARLVTDSGAAITDPWDASIAGFEVTGVFNPLAGISGEFFLTGRSFATGDPSGVYGERIDHTGSGQGTIKVELNNAPGPAGQIALNGPASQVLATWGDVSTNRVMGRIINSNGSFATDAFEISSVYPSAEPATGGSFDPHYGRYFVVIGDFMDGPVTGQFVAEDGTLDGAPITLIDSGDREYPYLAYDPGNRVYLLVWHNSRFINCQLVSPTGQLLGDPIELTSVHQSTEPRVAASTDRGGFLVVWRNTASMSLHAQLIGVEGSSLVFTDGFESGATGAWDPVRFQEKLS